MVEANQYNLTEDEADLYDRQIRLWGLDSQKRLRAATVLLIGLKGLGAEFCKNIVLAGIKSITLMDDKNATEEEKFSQFLIPREKLGSNRAAASLERAQRLNPMVEMKVDSDSVDSKTDEFFTQFHVVVATDCDMDQLLRINKICHNANVKFFCADVFGFYGYMFADLQTQEYMDEIKTVKKLSKAIGNKKQKLQDTEMVTVNKKGTLHYPTLQESLKVCKNIANMSKRTLADMVSFFLLKILLKFRADVGRNPQAATRVEDLETLKKIRESEMQSFKVAVDQVPDEYLSNLFSQISPICAILGGELAQEVIKTVSQKGEPHDNFFFFNPVRNHGIVIKNGH
ncbi:SUMO-activating enzyme subunit 1 [Macrosteles quadrilineatus]|uniref:SUMO-activating enzyme subunit 1 n=1 Tax=Macrosteles quadrilineatus TaxID=74068 RepID=UPI0023E12ABA|nr:SUMO-activating enzyme subunit 1 [Macrosteles quadrilineatus]XP_054265585.1 SUMO-activating enzyme subunit 1 [Macrosteles quadrilineatus]XP_054265586.1 SUMO-activating enzyme subunit 1 [Macrosteles quadrilineatus]